MARLQILYLPSVERDGVREQPFALIVDESVPDQPILPGQACDGEPLPEVPGQPVRLLPDREVMLSNPWDDFAKQIGGRGAFVTNERIDLVEPGDSDTVDLTVQFDTTEVVKEVADVLRARVESMATEAAESARRDAFIRAGRLP
jgi:hypothetical protein